MIKLINLSKSYNDNLVLNNLNNTFNSGLIYILGKSGSGKSTLLNILATFDKPSSGEVIINGININELSNKEINNFRKEELGFIFQQNNLIDSLNVYENIAYPLRINNYREKDIEKLVLKALDIINMRDFSKRNIDTLSGGEKQKVAIARAIVKKPNIIFADEITSSLDLVNKNEIMNILMEISKKTLVLFITHDETLLTDYPSEAYIIKNKSLKLVKEVKQNPIKKKVKKESENKRTNLFFQIKNSFKYILNNKIKLTTIILMLSILSSLLVFFLTLNSFSLKGSYNSFADKYDLKYLSFMDKTVIENSENKREFDTLLHSKDSLENTIYGFPISRSNDTLFDNILFIDETFNQDKLIGNLPTESNEVVITDYLEDTLYININLGDKINILNKEFIVSGIYKTDYTNKIGNNSETSKLVMKEKLPYLSGIYMYQNNYLNFHNNINEYYEDLLIENDLNLNLINKICITKNKSLNEYDVLISERLMDSFYGSSNNSYAITLINHKEKNILINIVGTSNTHDIEFSTKLFNILNEDRFGYIGLTDVNNLENIITQNILNESIIKPLKIKESIDIINQTLLIILIVGIILVFVFGFIMLYVILNDDKSIIGIKRSLGVSKFEIYIYYVSIFTIIGILSFIVSAMISTGSIYLYDMSFNEVYNYSYLSLNVFNYFILLVFNLLFLNLISIPYLSIYLNTEEIKLINN